MASPLAALLLQWLHSMAVSRCGLPTATLLTCQASPSEPLVRSMLTAAATLVLTHTPSPCTRSSAWWAGIGLWVLTGWTAYTVDKFLSAPCPKVIAADTHDEVVVWLSSMAVTSARVATPTLCANTLSTHTGWCRQVSRIDVSTIAWGCRYVCITSIAWKPLTSPLHTPTASVPDEQRDLQWLRAHALDSALVERFVRAMRRIALRVQPWLPCAEFADEEETQQQQVNYIARVLYDPTIPAAMPPLYRRDYEGDNHAVGVLARQAAAVAHVRSMFPVEPKPGVAEDDVVIVKVQTSSQLSLTPTSLPLQAHPLFDLRRMHLAGFFVAVCGIYSGTLRLGEALGDGVEGMEAFVATTLLYALPQHAACVPEDSHHKHSDHQAAPIGYQHQGQSWCRTNLAQCLATVTVSGCVQETPHTLCLPINSHTPTIVAGAARAFPCTAGRPGRCGCH